MATAAPSRLRITEIFHSLQGESRSSGFPTVFIRLTGCPLRCSYCDTEYAFTGGEWWDLPAILSEVEAYHPHYVCVTGGEPLAQKGGLPLLTALCDTGYQVSLETSGALDISQVDRRVSRIVDIKTPGSAEAAKNNYANIDHLTANDQMKFVICDEADYRWSCEQLVKYALTERCEVLFSPVHGRQDTVALAEWILRDRLTVRFQLQLHKILWGEQPGC
ncbi:MAG: 7-carboxy-7-deazaguanine synthase QueE [gamma proteobacterium endosymbiont of Lamellibrachia anaximandri]|nr:7-carboxy-7-deazaguanine synthase QueE [gamma proteobacterium endosymbiont of Lamellibrachia anaximandri]MBL3618628.1 7-carboxy-7-deazaguanine synthase QueE [gamma proteobacterium endosymbiont of Lamellibrachia anaximandri]